jgi:hypothetical protein
MQYYNLGKLLDEHECLFLKEEILQDEKNGTLSLETDSKYYNKSKGGINKSSWYLLNKFLPLVTEKTGKDLKIANPYSRIYRNESTLNPHLDRKDLDWTISLCIFSDIETPWPLKVKNTYGEILEFPSIPGYASLVNGIELEHWRDPLKCKDNEMVIQMFLHYTEVGKK